MEENTDETDLIWLEDDFVADLDSWFSADIKCCDNCYNDFVENWPTTIKRSKDFFAIDLETFYHGSNRVKYSYSLKVFLENIHLVKCPRCGEGLKGNIWPFEFPFDIEENLELEIALLKQNILKTPFLVLKNSLADKTFDVINELYSMAVETLIDFPLYRGRVIAKEKICNESFLAPPKEYTNEGRYNHSGIPVMYLANEKITCYNELRKPEKDFHIAEFSINNSSFKK